MSVTVLRSDAAHLPLADDSVDLIVTSPPYFGLRSYQDGGEHYAGQIGDETTPAEFVDALIDCTREWMRVLKPSGSMWINLGDKYAQAIERSRNGNGNRVAIDGFTGGKPLRNEIGTVSLGRLDNGVQRKSLMGIPWRYALRCIDDLGLILRAEVIWSKPNGLPESVTDRVRRSHEQWFHFTAQPRYFSAVDEVREVYTAPPFRGQKKHGATTAGQTSNPSIGTWDATDYEHNPLGKLPGSVWTVPTEPLRVPESLGIDHFAAFPTEWPRRLVLAWSPSGVCVECGAGRRPVSSKHVMPDKQGRIGRHGGPRADAALAGPARAMLNGLSVRTITGYTCACPEPTADTRPAVVLDPFGGTGTTAHVAHALGRHGISNDLSADYCRIADDPTVLDGRVRKILGVAKPPPVIDGQGDLFEVTA